MSSHTRMCAVLLTDWAVCNLTSMSVCHSVWQSDRKMMTHFKAKKEIWMNINLKKQSCCYLQIALVRQGLKEHCIF